MIWAMNGCDTFAYADRTLADRRAVLNPDDPGGTKYMDVVSNALGAWFHAGDDTALSFLGDLAAGGADRPVPKTYREIFSVIDPSQVVLVTGEEDNEDPIRPAGGASGDPATAQPLAIPVGAPEPSDAGSRNVAGCTAARPPQPGASWAGLLLVGVGLVALRRRD